MPGKRESDPKARPINDQPGADSRRSRGYSLQPSDGAWHLRGAGTRRRKRDQKRERERVRGEGKYDGVNVCVGERERDGQDGERKGGGKAKNALLVNPVASHAHTLVHMQRPKIVISWDITRRPTPSHRTCFIPGAAINHAMFNKLQRVGLRNNTHIRREFTRARECCPAILAVFFFFYYTSGVVLFLSVFNHCLSQSRVCGILRFGRGRAGEG